ncbi:MAG: regulatory protein RecX [Dokdonella sp.]|uniref:regulatory protein RecX n=1 Tax=Dokdonella sp. TaxID=2291710 RepID=UPI002CE2F86A|nr:regulatory protein RecX [Xanthomonadales bacterium]HQV72016.1 regulatory protein RecX [Dokdonella sp.]MBL0221977.1 regulatory protein RecX [Xanthomonadales bacterium]HQW76671.1 regulatory protein RecX [Dokdonella sp.]HQX65208.1 regulatory protein RecX [Dokdonella sp.]
MSDGKPTKPAKEKPNAYNKALGLLVRREQSARELKTKLDRSGFSRDESATAIDALKKQAYQSDERFAELLARSRAANGYGPRRIFAELKSHGISDAEINAAIGALDCDWRDLARRQLQRHYGRKPVADNKERGRRAAFLLRRGFDAATVSALTRADIGDPGDEFD